MLDFLRDLTKSAEEKRQEMLTAYVDGELSPAQQQKLEQLLVDDPSLQAELAQLQQFKQSMSQLPRRRVPRNFTLNPAVYSTPARQPLIQLYPMMRTAMSLTAVFLVIAFAAEILTTGSLTSNEAASSAPVAMQTSGDAADTADEMAELAVEESVAEAEDMDSANVAPTAEAMIEAEPAEMEEEAVEEPPMAEMAAEELQMPLEEEPSELVQATMAAPVQAEVEVQTEEESAMGAADDGSASESELAPAPNATFAGTPTAAATAAATTADTPRIAATDTPSERAITQPTPEVTEVAVVPEPTEDKAVVEDTAVDELNFDESLSIYRVVQIVLGILLIILVIAVFYTRRQL
ncbi:MAG: hypothetical protein GY943_16595 [Chloroflexi bacterium]|nr:hypothetical protein [Chloroflexota bacterium]